jgi:hypothetical protein
LERFEVRESHRGLGLPDRLGYLGILNVLNAFLNISKHPAPNLVRTRRLKNQGDALMKLHTILARFDHRLADAFARDSHTSAPPTTPA